MPAARNSCSTTMPNDDARDLEPEQRRRQSDALKAMAHEGYFVRRPFRGRGCAPVLLEDRWSVVLWMNPHGHIGAFDDRP